MTEKDELDYIDLEDGIKIAYLDEGDKRKPCLFFIHGLANYHQVWHLNTSFLKTHFRCVSIDLPGNGFSSRGKDQYGIPFYAEIVVRCCQAMNLRKVNLVGHSMGGQIALYLAIKVPELIASLVLCAPAGLEYFTPHEASLFKTGLSYSSVLAPDETQLMHSINSSFYANHPMAKQIIDDLSLLIQQHDRASYREMLKLSIHSMLDNQVFQHLKDVHQDTLVFFGENDQLIPNRFLHMNSTKELIGKGIEKMPHARLVMYKECGHFVQIERAQKVNESILHFMTGR